MTMLLLTAEAATVFGATVWVLLRLWVRSRQISMADVAFYEYVAESGRKLAAKGQTDPLVPEPRAVAVGVSGTARESGVRLGMKLPYSPSAGPKMINSSRVEGFERSPLGAIVAAINLASRHTGVDLLGRVRSDSAFRCESIVLSVVPAVDDSDIGPETGLIASRRRPGVMPVVPALREPAEEIREHTSSVLQMIEVRGWHMERYSSENAAIRYVLSLSGGGGGVTMMVLRVEVNWADGDWKVVAPPAGDWSETFGTDVDASCFTLFPARSSLPSPAR